VQTFLKIRQGVSELTDPEKRHLFIDFVHRPYNSVKMHLQKQYNNMYLKKAFIALFDCTECHFCAKK